MRVTEKIDLIDKLARELSRRYSDSEIDYFFNELGCVEPNNWSQNSFENAKHWLFMQTNELLRSIASELEFDVSLMGRAIGEPPENWKQTDNFRLFISHISTDKNIATRLREELKKYSISGFVAHEDINPSLDWQNQIERALHHMDAMVAVHTEGFSNSNWTQQEIGFALGRGVYVISFKWGEDPTGFISRLQALPRKKRQADEIAKEINSLLQESHLTSAKLISTKTPLTPENYLDDDIPF